MYLNTRQCISFTFHVFSIYILFVGLATHIFLQRQPANCTGISRASPELGYVFSHDYFPDTQQARGIVAISAGLIRCIATGLSIYDRCPRLALKRLVAVRLVSLTAVPPPENDAQMCDVITFRT